MSERELREKCREKMLSNILSIIRDSRCDDINKSTSVNNLATAYLKLVEAENMKRRVE